MRAGGTGRWVHRPVRPQPAPRSIERHRRCEVHGKICPSLGVAIEKEQDKKTEIEEQIEKKRARRKLKTKKKRSG